MWKFIVLSVITIALITLVNIGERNLIVLLLCLELLFFAAAVTCIYMFYCSSEELLWNYDLLFGAIAVTVMAAAESVVGLAIIALLHDKSRTIRVKKL